MMAPSGQLRVARCFRAAVMPVLSRTAVALANSQFIRGTYDAVDPSFGLKRSMQEHALPPRCEKGVRQPPDRAIVSPAAPGGLGQRGTLRRRIAFRVGVHRAMREKPCNQSPCVPHLAEEAAQRLIAPLGRNAGCVS
jgi:hypothetical protein